MSTTLSTLSALSALPFISSSEHTVLPNGDLVVYPEFDIGAPSPYCIRKADEIIIIIPKWDDNFINLFNEEDVERIPSYEFDEDFIRKYFNQPEAFHSLVSLLEDRPIEPWILESILPALLHKAPPQSIVLSIENMKIGELEYITNKAKSLKRIDSDKEQIIKEISKLF